MKKIIPTILILLNLAIIATGVVIFAQSNFVPLFSLLAVIIFTIGLIGIILVLVFVSGIKAIVKAIIALVAVSAAFLSVRYYFEQADYLQSQSQRYIAIVMLEDLHFAEYRFSSEWELRTFLAKTVWYEDRKQRKDMLNFYRSLKLGSKISDDPAIEEIDVQGIASSVAPKGALIAYVSEGPDAQKGDGEEVALLNLPWQPRYIIDDGNDENSQ